MQHISTIHRIPEFYTKTESDSHFYNAASLASQATDSPRMRLKKTSANGLWTLPEGSIAHTGQ